MLNTMTNNGTDLLKLFQNMIRGLPPAFEKQGKINFCDGIAVTTMINHPVYQNAFI